MERLIGVRAYSLRLPMINEGDNLPRIILSVLNDVCANENVTLNDSDVIGVTEAVVARAQANYATIDDIALDIVSKFGENAEIGLVFPIMSRNRFLNVLKGIAKGAKKTYVLLKYPSDEVGNPIMDSDDYIDSDMSGIYTADEFKIKNKGYLHPFTGMDYISMYENAHENIEVLLSDNPCDILQYTKDIVVCEIHNRFTAKKQLIKAGADKICMLSEILSEPVNNSGYNPQYGLLGSNMSTSTRLKLFPRDCASFVEDLQREILTKTGKSPEILIYGDGAFKDPTAGIWELADPVVSPAYTKRLGATPREIKFKLAADNIDPSLSPDERRLRLNEIIAQKDKVAGGGTTPRKYADLLGSLCDLTSGSGDKGTPVVLIQGYFDDYTIG